MKTFKYYTYIILIFCYINKWVYYTDNKIKSVIDFKLHSILIILIALEYFIGSFDLPL